MSLVRSTLYLSSILLLSACSAAKPKPDAPVVQKVAALPMPVPEQTVFLLRFEPSKLQIALDRVGLKRPWQVVPNVLLTRFGNETPRVDGGEFPGLDENRSIVVAGSLHGNQRLLDRMRMHAPKPAWEAVPRGLFMRMYLPAKDPEALATWTREFCESPSSECSEYTTISEGKDSVTIDYRYGDLARDFYTASGAPAIEAPQDETGFEPEISTARQAFIANDAAFGIHLRSEYLTELVGLIGMTELFEALEKATPENRLSLFVAGYRMASDAFIFESPEAREIADSTLLVTAAGASGLRADVIGSHTELGSRVHDAAMQNASLPTIKLPGALAFLNVGYDYEAAISAAKTPEWLVATNESERRGTLLTIQQSGPMAGFIRRHNYSAGSRRGSREAGLGRLDQNLVRAPSSTRNWRIALDAKAVDGGPLPFEFTGGFLARLGGGADTEAVKRDLMELSAQLLTNFTFEKLSTDEQETVWWHSPNTELGDPAPMKSILSGYVDLTKLASIFSAVPFPFDQDGRIEAFLRKMEMARFDSRSLEGGFHAHLTLGFAESEAPTIDASLGPVAQPAADSKCLREVQETSRRALAEADGDSEDLELPIIDALDAAAGKCASAEEAIRTAQVGWLLWRMTRLMKLEDNERAKEAYERVCELDADGRYCVEDDAAP